MADSLRGRTDAKMCVSQVGSQHEWHWKFLVTLYPTPIHWGGGKSREESRGGRRGREGKESEGERKRERGEGKWREEERKRTC